MFEVVGIFGIAISVAAYLPQVVHLAREHCSAGVSSRAWAMWFVGGLLVGMLAVHRRDPIFMVLQLNSLVSASLVLFLARKYRGRACESHAHLVSPAPAITKHPATRGTVPAGVEHGHPQESLRASVGIAPPTP